ncbi:hypothetical protein KsCSTR_42870 [Candidatus Kuenenia stuttgartiensis]|uniref:Uncharacterized protein n=1 Tax=Kuenenia stuttgartiensis TaxID=174633 RepID=Q1PX86_KUEST|nr:hypothetical protein KsCSTR_42870 [Candidatus Kuenenia stuttgartiensis]CAJ71843.1 unknown protein [Candidatus Kuenenia stuttgartiensis]
MYGWRYLNKPHPRKERLRFFEKIHFRKRFITIKEVFSCHQPHSLKISLILHIKCSTYLSL